MRNKLGQFPCPRIGRLTERGQVGLDPSLRIYSVSSELDDGPRHVDVDHPWSEVTKLSRTEHSFSRIASEELPESL